jgi:predicted AlkP superfamily phosphohydrolase/phosphomutase
VRVVSEPSRDCAEFPVRVLCLGLDGADHDLVRGLIDQGKLPTISRLARDGVFGPLRSTIPAVTPTAWSSFLTGLNPAGHGIFNFSTNPNRSPQRVESAASRGGTPFWRLLAAAGLRSAFVGIPFTYPAEPIAGIVVTGYGGPERPQILPSAARERILAAHPDLVTAHHPMAERWWEDFDGYARRLVQHVEQTADVCRLALELEPDLRLLCVDFMSADHAGHLGYSRLDPDHPAHDPAQAGNELVQVYEAVDRACGELIDAAATRLGEEPTAIVISDHGMKPIYWTFHANRWLEEAGHLRYRRRSLQPLKGGALNVVAKVDQRLARTTKPYARALDAVPLLPRPRADRTFADVDYGSTRAYCFATGGQIFLGEASSARRDRLYADRLADELAAIRHPESEEPAFEVRRKEELYHGPFLDKAPELVILPRDERIHVESSRRAWAHPFERHETLDPSSFYGYSGHHGLYGILAAAGPGIGARAALASSAEIVQLPATLLRLLGLAAEGLDGPALDGILDVEEPATARSAAPASAPAGSRVYTEEQERELLEHLRDLGYE